MRWPALTILGIGVAVTVGIIHAAALRVTAELADCLLGEADLPHTQWADGFGPDGYGNR